MARFAWQSLFALATLAAACTPQGGGGGNPGNPTPAPSAREFTGEPQTLPAGPSAEGLTLVDSQRFEGASVPFADGVGAAAMASGSFAAGQWVAGSGTYTQSEAGNSTKLSIRRYTGAVGDRYRVEVTGWIYRAVTADPAKEQGVSVLMPFYVDEKHYVICSTSASLAEAWVCNGQAPGESWPTANRLWGGAFNPARVVGTATTWTCDVDVPAHSLTIYLDGDRKASVTTPLIDSGPHSVALASNGSQVRFANFKLYSLGSAAARPTPAPTRTPAPAPSAAPSAAPTPTSRRTPIPLPSVTLDEEAP